MGVVSAKAEAVSPAGPRYGRPAAPYPQKIRPQRSGVGAEKNVGAAGQHKGRHHEKNKSCARRRILEPHDRYLPLGRVLFYFGSIQNTRTKRDRISLNAGGVG